MTDTLIFASPIMRNGLEKPKAEPWKILVVDDEPDIHAITKIALSDFSLDHRGISQLHAYSAKEARSILAENPDIAVLLLDVVMESDTAGLDLVRYIRDVIGNKTMRIVLRTGNPAHAPERRVIADYDINDYREKSELTTQKLNTVMYTALRSYRDLEATEHDKKMLEKLVDATATLFMQRSPEDIAAYALEQVCALLDITTPEEESTTNAFLAVARDNKRITLLSATGSFAVLKSGILIDNLPADLAKDISAALAHDGLYQRDDKLVVRAMTEEHSEYLAYVEGAGELRDTDKRLLGLLLRKTIMALEALEQASRPPSADIVRIH